MKITKRKTKKSFIPVADCPSCGLKDTPLSQKHEIFIHKHTGKKLDLWFISCPQCDWLANMDKDSWSHVKGYTSIAELEANGYTKEVK